VSIKGYVRSLQRLANGAHVPIYARGTMKYLYNDCKHQKLGEGSVTVNEYGSFALKLAMPDTMNLGNVQVIFRFLRLHRHHRYHSVATIVDCCC
jgi:hypothetical protein